MRTWTVSPDVFLFAGSLGEFPGAVSHGPAFLSPVIHTALLGN
jgi:hypothetical protein